MRVVRENLKIHDFLIFLNFTLVFTYFYAHIKCFFAHFSAKIFTTEIVTAQENLLLECLACILSPAPVPACACAPALAPAPPVFGGRSLKAAELECYQ